MLIMNCCPPTIVSFGNVSSTTINYSPSLAALYGVDPNVQVYYKDGTEYVLSDDQNEVKFNGVDIVVDHGGIAVGFLKIF